MAEENFQHIVRVANTDLKGGKHILYALKKVKGVGHMLAHAVCRVTGIDTQKKAGNLSQDEIKKLNNALTKPKEHGIPVYMLNRRKDYQSGEDIHLLTNELAFSKENDLKRLKKIRCYRGVRHMFGMPARGQRTRSNFRRNKGKVLGVKRKK